MKARLDQLNSAKAKLDAFRPLPAAVVSNLREDLNLRWTYHSNAIEGNTLTLKETKVVLEGITVGGKAMREHLEAINHQKAIHFLEELVNDDQPLDDITLRSIHQLILKGIDDENAGRYRGVNVRISGAEHVPPDFLDLPGEIERFFNWYRGEAPEMHPVLRAAQVHADFVGIHPFADGNGRTSRLLMNLELMNAGYPVVIVPVERRLEYYQHLDSYHVGGDLTPFVELVIDLTIEAFAPYFQILGEPY